MQASAVRRAFIKSLPILCSYIFLGISYGLLMTEAGFQWFYTLFASVFVFTGAGQFVMITLMSSAASVATVAVTIFLLSSRHFFYGMTMLQEYKAVKGPMGRYMETTLSDETFAVVVSMSEDEPQRDRVRFFIHLFDQCYWVIGSLIGAILGQILPFDMEGIDFCMTALFVIIVIDQWEKDSSHRPAIVGLILALVCLAIFGQSSFMLPALLGTCAILLIPGVAKGNGVARGKEASCESC